MNDDDDLKSLADDSDNADDERALKPLDLDMLDDEIEDTHPTESDTVGDVPEEASGEVAPAQPAEAPGFSLDLEPVNLDVLDDEIEPVTVELDDKAEDMLDTIQTLDDEIEPLAASEPVEPVEPPETPAPPTEPEEPAAEPAALPIPETRYRVLIPLPAEVSEQVVSLRKTGQIKGSPPPGVELGQTFRTADLEAVQDALTDWARAHLPLQLEITGIQTEVVGAQQYVAAWFLQPQKELKKAHDDLLNRLESLALLNDEPPSAASVRVIIGDHIAARPYPRVIAQMQQLFEPYVWHAESATLVRMEPTAHRWETVGSFD